jgi:hypothetical protein
MPNSYIIQELTSHDCIFYRSLIAHLPKVYLLFILGPAIISILSTDQQYVVLFKIDTHSYIIKEQTRDDRMFYRSSAENSSIIHTLTSDYIDFVHWPAVVLFKIDTHSYIIQELTRCDRMFYHSSTDNSSIIHTLTSDYIDLSLPDQRIIRRGKQMLCVTSVWIFKLSRCVSLVKFAGNHFPENSV